MCLALKVSCIQNCHDLSRFRLASQFHHDAFHDLEVMEPKQIQHVFLVQNGPVSEKDRDLVGFV